MCRFKTPTLVHLHHPSHRKAYAPQGSRVPTHLSTRVMPTRCHPSPRLVCFERPALHREVPLTPTPLQSSPQQSEQVHGNLVVVTTRCLRVSVALFFLRKSYRHTKLRSPHAATSDSLKEASNNQCLVGATVHFQRTVSIKTPPTRNRWFKAPSPPVSIWMKILT